jgi:hypothetical protein
VQQAVRPFSGRPTIENLVDYINRLVCHLRRLTHAVIVFDHVHRDVHAQHARRAQHQISHTDIGTDTSQPRALRGTQPATLRINHEPTLVILCSVAMF